MDMKILNIYNNRPLIGTKLKGNHGQSFYLEFENERILFDTGRKGELLLHNMSELGVRPNEINKIIFSHGHNDHTGGLISLLRKRTIEEKILIISHPAFQERKSLKILGIRVLNIGLPKINSELEKKVSFSLTKELFEVNPYLFFTGEVKNRPEKDGTSNLYVRFYKGKWEKDPLIDDISLVLKARDGLVLICGCCHAGLLNTCAYISELFNEKISAIIGGTHMMSYSKKEVEHVADVLEKKYGTPKLFLNHCTGKKKIKQLEIRFGSEIVKPCLVGTELFFKC
ncbi:MAG: MBL fold metallo-hydrolase [Promethearchaeota archaeon]